MEDFEVVESLEAAADLEEDVPNLGFFHVCGRLGASSNPLIQVGVIRKLHDNTNKMTLVLPQRVGCDIDKCFAVTYNVRMLDGRQYSDFVEGILLLFVVQVIELDFFQSIFLRVLQSPNFIDRRVCALTFIGKVLYLVSK